ncbi:MAG: 50S ribosomal protein L31 [bacterium]|nr:50S ribosomal protein L31 [bacterium]
MKVDTHPQYNDLATVTCACGNTFKVGSTKDNIVVEICSNCHPFYTGNEKSVDAAGRVDRFKTRMAKAAPKKAKAEKTEK